MERQCAGCGTVFEDGQEPKGPNENGPRPLGCCPECNKHTFRSNERPTLVKDVEVRPVDELAEESA